MEFVFLFLLLWVALGGGIGYAIGNTKGRGAAGFWLGMLLGWIGWIIVALLQPTVQWEAQRNLQVAAATSSSSASSRSARETTPAARRNRSRAERDTSLRATESMRNASQDGSKDDARRVTAINNFVEEVCPQKPVHEWFMADGHFVATARTDGNLYLLSDTASRRVGFGADASFDETSDGQLLAATIEGVVLTNPRPDAKARALLDGLRARRVVRDPPSPEPNVQETSRGAGASEPWTPPTTPAERTITQRLADLDQLRRDGLISDDEYADRRLRILDDV